MKAKKDNKLIVGYVRSAVKNDLSVKSQEKSINDYCLKNGVELAKVFVDNGCSGANLQRPALNKLITEAKAGKIKEIIAYDSARLTRSISDFIALKGLMEQCKVEVRTIMGSTTNPNDEFFNEILATTNAFYSKVSKRRCDCVCNCACCCRNR